MQSRASTSCPLFAPSLPPGATTGISPGAAGAAGAEVSAVVVGAAASFVLVGAPGSVELGAGLSESVGLPTGATESDVAADEGAGREVLVRLVRVRLVVESGALVSLVLPTGTTTGAVVVSGAAAGNGRGTGWTGQRIVAGRGQDADGQGGRGDSQLVHCPPASFGTEHGCSVRSGGADQAASWPAGSTARIKVVRAGQRRMECRDFGRPLARCVPESVAARCAGVGDGPVAAGVGDGSIAAGVGDRAEDVRFGDRPEGLGFARRPAGTCRCRWSGTHAARDGGHVLEAPGSGVPAPASESRRWFLGLLAPAGQRGDRGERG